MTRMDIHGQLQFYGVFPYLSPIASEIQKPVDGPSGDSHVIDAASSDGNIVFIMDNGSSQTAGSNEFGQLGIDSQAKDEKPLSIVKSDVLFKVGACGKQFTLWISKDNKLYVSGLSIHYAPTLINGFEGTKVAAYNQTAAICDSNLVTLWPYFPNTNIFIKKELPGKIFSISCGNRFVCALLDNQTLYRIDNDANISAIMRPINPFDNGNRFIFATASESYIAAIDTNHDAWIINEGKSINRSSPVMSEVDQIYAFPEHTVMVDSQFIGYSFGLNDNGQLGNGKQSGKIYKPLQMDSPFAIWKVLGGKKYTLLLPIAFTRDLVQISCDDFVPGSVSIHDSKNAI